MSSQPTPQYRINLRPYRLILWPLALPVALLLAFFNLLSPVPVKIYVIRVDRIGQMAANQEEFFCQLDLGLLPKEYRFFVYRDRPSNRALLAVLKRAMHICQWLLPVYDLCHKLGGLGVSSKHLLDIYGDDAEKLATQTTQHVNLIHSESEQAKKECRELGIDPEQPFVPVLGRDNLYLSSIGEPTDTDSYRNTDIKLFIPAMEYLADRFTVIRVGSVAKERLITQHPNILDYTFSGKRTELLDVYFSAKCHFFLSCGSGLDTIASNLFRLPVLYVNWTPLAAVYMLKPWTCFIPKKYWLRSEGRFLTLSEILESGVGDMYTPRELDPLDITIIDNTPEEILEATQEMVARLDGDWNETAEDKERQRLFWSYFEKNNPHRKYTVNICASFINKNNYLLK